MLIESSRLISEFGESWTDWRANHAAATVRIIVAGSPREHIPQPSTVARSAVRFRATAKFPSDVTAFSSIEVSKSKQVKSVFGAAHS